MKPFTVSLINNSKRAAFLIGKKQMATIKDKKLDGHFKKTMQDQIITRLERRSNPESTTMQIKRIITAEGKNGVATRTDTFDTSTIDFLTNIWGFDRVPDLPLRPEQVLGEYQKMGIFGPLGGIRVDLFTLAPETAEVPAALERAVAVDMGTPNMVPGKEGDGMHRTDSIDLAIVLEGEVKAGYPGEDGQVHEVMMKAGDLIVTNGTFHSWHNRSDKNCTMLFVVLGAERKVSR